MGKQKRPALKVKVIHKPASDAAGRLSRSFEILLKSATSQAEESPDTEKEAKGRVRRCVEIDLECLPFDTSGFEEPV